MVIIMIIYILVPGLYVCIYIILNLYYLEFTLKEIKEEYYYPTKENLATKCPELESVGKGPGVTK